MVNIQNGSHGGQRIGSMKNCANTKHLKRILVVLGEAENPIPKIEITNRTGITKQINDALLFLTKYGLVEGTSIPNTKENRRRFGGWVNISKMYKISNLNKKKIENE